MACTIDFRCLDEGFGGKTLKRKRAEEELLLLGKNKNELELEPEEMEMEMEIDGWSSKRKRRALASSEDPNKPVLTGSGKATYDGVIAGRVSGRKWKQVRTRRASATKVCVKGKTVEERGREKEINKAYKERINELKEEIKKKKQDKRKKKGESEKRKAENILRTGTKLQKITNPKTLKKIAKSAKDRKRLKVLSDAPPKSIPISN